MSDLNVSRRVDFVAKSLTTQLTASLTAAVTAAVWHNFRTSKSQRNFEEVVQLVASDMRSHLERVTATNKNNFDLYLRWMAGSLKAALDTVENLDLEKISALRRYGKDSKYVFEEQLDEVRSRLVNGRSSVKEATKDIFENPDHYDVRVIDLVGKVEKRCDVVLRILLVLRNPPITFIALDLRAWHLIACGIALVPIFYLILGAGPESTPPIPQRFAEDTEELLRIWKQQSSGISRVAGSAQFIASLVTAIPALLMACTIPLLMLRRYVFRSTFLQNRIAEKEAGLRELAKSLRLPSDSFLSIGSIDMSSKKITIKGSTVNAPVTIADSITDSLNTIESSGTDEQVKELLEQLLKEIAEIGNGWGNHTDTVTKDSKSLSTELASDAPRRKWYELSIQGIADAAEAIGKIGNPVLNTVKTLLPILVKLYP